MRRAASCLYLGCYARVVQLLALRSDIERHDTITIKIIWILTCRYELLCCICALHIQPRKHAVDHAVLPRGNMSDIVQMRNVSALTGRSRSLTVLQWELTIQNICPKCVFCSPRCLVWLMPSLDPRYRTHDLYDLYGQFPLHVNISGRIHCGSV